MLLNIHILNIVIHQIHISWVKGLSDIWIFIHPQKFTWNLNWIYSISINKVTSKTLMDKCNTVHPCFFTHYVGSVFLMRQQWLYDSAIFNRSLPKLLNRLEYYWLRSYFYIHTVGEGVRWWYAIFGAKSQRPTCWIFYSWISNCFLSGHSCTNLLSLSRLLTM